MTYILFINFYTVFLFLEELDIFLLCSSDSFLPLCDFDIFLFVSSLHLYPLFHGVFPLCDSDNLILVSSLLTFPLFASDILILVSLEHFLPLLPFFISDCFYGKIDMFNHNYSFVFNIIY